MTDWDPTETYPREPLSLTNFVLDPQRWTSAPFTVDDDESRYRGDRYHLLQYYEDWKRRTVARIERDVHQHVLFSGDTAVPFTVQAPWAALIPVPIERTIWQRLTRQPVRYEWVQVKGRVTASGKVTVNVRDARGFPDAPTYPAELGKPIVYQSVELRYTLADHLRTEADTAHVADDGDDFAELARDLPNDGVIPTDPEEER